jgi:hypothetical protein
VLPLPLRIRSVSGIDDCAAPFALGNRANVINKAKYRRVVVYVDKAFRTPGLVEIAAAIHGSGPGRVDGPRGERLRIEPGSPFGRRASHISGFLGGG